MQPLGLPRCARLLKPADFSALRGASRRVGASHFVAEIGNTMRTNCRLGQAVSRRVSKRAVDRNRIKRVVRESYRRARSALPPRDILLIARSSAVAQSNLALRDDLDRLWGKLAALKPDPVTGTMRG